MRKAILFIACILSINTYACADDQGYELPFFRETNQTFIYWNAGVGPLFLIPNVGVGIRNLDNHYGWDLSLNAGTVFHAYSVQIIASALYIPEPQSLNPVYFGIGMAGGIFAEKIAYGGVSPDFLFGIELNNKSFLEAHFQIPTLAYGRSSKYSMSFPFSIKYGMSF